MMPDQRAGDALPSTDEAHGAQPQRRRFDTVAARLEALQQELPADHFSLQWLTATMGRDSAGLMILIVALLAAVPGVSVVAGLFLLVLSIQLVAGRPRSRFPDWIAARPLPSRALSMILRRAVPALRQIERIVHRRGSIATTVGERVAGLAIIMLSIRLLTNPLPFSSIVPALVIALIALAYLEEDGVLLAAALGLALFVLTADIALLWKLLRPFL